MKLLITLIAMIALSGCAVLSQNAGPYLVKGAKKYCDNASLAEREIVRQYVNTELAAEGHKVGARCAGDPPLEL